MLRTFLLVFAVLAIIAGGVIIHTAPYGRLGAPKRRVGIWIVYVGVIIIIVVVKVYFPYY